jgi:hypothetical protein
LYQLAGKSLTEKNDEEILDRLLAREQILCDFPMLDVYI